MVSPLAPGYIVHGGQCSSQNEDAEGTGRKLDKLTFVACC